MRPIQYLNTDLELTASFDLEPLVQAFSGRGASALHAFVRDDGSWSAGLETDKCFSSPEPCCDALLTAIESLDPDSRRLWDACSRRVFDIGYECGDEPFPFTSALTVATIARMTALNISLSISVYPAEVSQIHSPESPASDADITGQRDLAR